MVQMSKAGMRNTVSLKAGHPPAGMISLFKVFGVQKVSESFVFGLCLRVEVGFGFNKELSFVAFKAHWGNFNVLWVDCAVVVVDIVTDFLCLIPRLKIHVHTFVCV